MIILIGLIVVGAFLLQGLFGIFQIKNFSRNYRELRLLGPYRILIGKNPKRFFSGSLMLIAIDNDGNIKMIKSNIIAINEIISDVANKIQIELDNKGKEDIEIALRKFYSI